MQRPRQRGVDIQTAAASAAAAWAADRSECTSVGHSGSLELSEIRAIEKLSTLSWGVSGFATSHDRPNPNLANMSAAAAVERQRKKRNEQRVK